MDDSIIIGRKSFWENQFLKIENDLIIGDQEDWTLENPKITFCGKVLRMEKRENKIVITQSLDHYAEKLKGLAFVKDLNLETAKLD